MMLMPFVSPHLFSSIDAVQHEYTVTDFRNSQITQGTWAGQFNFVDSGNPNQLLVMALATAGYSLRSTNSVSFDGVAGTRFIDAGIDGLPNQAVNLDLYYWLATDLPLVDGDKTFNIVLSGNNSNHNVVWMLLSGVDQSAPLSSAQRSELTTLADSATIGTTQTGQTDKFIISGVAVSGVGKTGTSLSPSGNLSPGDTVFFALTAADAELISGMYYDQSCASAAEYYGWTLSSSNAGEGSASFSCVVNSA